MLKKSNQTKRMHGWTFSRYKFDISQPNPIARENVSRCTTGVGKIIELPFSILIYNFGCIRHNTLTCVEFESNLTFSGHHLIPKVVIIIVYCVALKTENGKVDFSGENAITRSGGPAHVLMHL